MFAACFSFFEKIKSNKLMPIFVAFNFFSRLCDNCLSPVEWYVDCKVGAVFDTFFSFANFFLSFGRLICKMNFIMTRTKNDIK